MSLFELSDRPFDFINPKNYELRDIPRYRVHSIFMILSMFLWKPFGRAARYWKKLTLRYFVFLRFYYYFLFIYIYIYIYIYIHTNHPNHREIVTRKMSSESAVSNKVSSRQPPAPIFSSDLDNRTRSSHSGLVYGHKKPGKVMEF